MKYTKDWTFDRPGARIKSKMRAYRSGCRRHRLASTHAIFLSYFNNITQLNQSITMRLIDLIESDWTFVNL